MAGPIYEEVSTNMKLELRESVAYEPVQSIQLKSSWGFAALICFLILFFVYCKAFSINNHMVPRQ